MFKAYRQRSIWAMIKLFSLILQLSFDTTVSTTSPKTYQQFKQLIFYSKIYNYWQFFRIPKNLSKLLNIYNAVAHFDYYL